MGFSNAGNSSIRENRKLVRQPPYFAYEPPKGPRKTGPQAPLPAEAEDRIAARKRARSLFDLGLMLVAFLISGLALYLFLF